MYFYKINIITLPTQPLTHVPGMMSTSAREPLPRWNGLVFTARGPLTETSQESGVPSGRPPSLGHHHWSEGAVADGPLI